MRTDMFQQVLEELKGSSADVEASALISTDGLMIASALPAGMDEDRVGAMSAALLSLGDRAASEQARGTLDRVLLHNHFLIPNWHNRAFWIAFWDRFGRPPRNPRYGLGFPSDWWVDAAKDRALQDARRSL